MHAHPHTHIQEHAHLYSTTPHRHTHRQAQIHLSHNLTISYYVNADEKTHTELIFTAKTKYMAQWSLNVSLGVW